MSMNWMFAIAAGVVTIGASGAHAQPAKDVPNRVLPGGPPWIQARIMFQWFDADRDSALSVDEVPDNAWEYLSAADTNEDDVVTQAEVMQLIATRFVGNFDENEDGELTADEVPAPVWDRLMVADADESRSVSETEILATLKAAPRRGGPPTQGR